MGALSLCFAATIHIGLSGDYNESHPCVYVEHEFVVAGAFQNSEGNSSAFVGVRGDVELAFGVEAFIEVGAATGYSFNPVMPFGRIGLEKSFDPLTVAVFVLPAPETDTNRIGAAVGAEARLKLLEW